MEDLSSISNGGGVLEAVKTALKAAPEWLKSQFQWIVVLGILWIGYIETGARSAIKEMQGDIKDMSAAVVQMAGKMDVMSNDISHIKETLGKHEGRIEKQSDRIDRIKDRQ